MTTWKWVKHGGGDRVIWELHRDGKRVADVNRFCRGAAVYAGATLPPETVRSGAMNTIGAAKAWARKVAETGDTGHIGIRADEHRRKIERGDYMMAGFIEGFRFAAELMPELKEALAVLEAVPVQEGVVVTTTRFSAEVELRGPRGAVIGRVLEPWRKKPPVAMPRKTSDAEKREVFRQLHREYSNRRFR